jgi:uncharacterized protein YybS (DUF2232 family)
MVGNFLLPLPVTLLFIRHDYKVTLAAVAVSTTMIAFLYNPLWALVAGITSGLTGVTLGYCVKRELKGSLSILYLTFSSIISTIVSGAIIIFLILNQNVYKLVKQQSDMFKESNELTKNLGTQLGIPAAQFDQVNKMWEMLTPEYIMYLLPAIIILSAFMSAFINYMVTRSILKKMKYDLKALTPFERIYLDNRIGALIVIVMCIGIILVARGFSIGNYLSNSAFYIFMFAFSIVGISLAVYYLNNKLNIRKPLLILIIGFALISQLGQIFLFLGIADMAFDFRKLDPNRMRIKKNK